MVRRWSKWEEAGRQAERAWRGMEKLKENYSEIGFAKFWENKPFPEHLLGHKDSQVTHAGGHDRGKGMGEMWLWRCTCVTLKPGAGKRLAWMKVSGFGSRGNKAQRDSKGIKHLWLALLCLLYRGDLKDGLKANSHLFLLWSMIKKTRTKSKELIDAFVIKFSWLYMES